MRRRTGSEADSALPPGSHRDGQPTGGLPDREDEGPPLFHASQNQVTVFPSDAMNRGLAVLAAGLGGSQLFVDQIDLDEIGDVSPAFQVRLLRILQEKCFEPLGSEKTVTVDVRVLAATNRRLDEMVENGTFRRDLYYRINVVHVTIPSLRERREDIPLLIREFLNQHALNGVEAEVSREAMRFFLDYPWPGNIRELENVIERCVFLAEDGEISLHDLPGEMLAASQEQTNFSFDQIKPLAEIEMEYIKYVLNKCDGNKQKSAALLGINRKTIHRKLET